MRETVAAVACDLQVGWHTVRRAVVDYSAPLGDDPDRLASVATLGVDEHVWVHASANRCTGYAPGIVDITPTGQPPPQRRAWSHRHGVRRLDRRTESRLAPADPRRRARPVPGYATALATALPDATRMLDAFHLVARANKMVDEVRQRIQQKMLGHRGRNGDPLYEIRRLLRHSIKTLPNRTRRNIDIALQVGDRPTPSPSPGSCAPSPPPRGRPAADAHRADVATRLSSVVSR